MKSGAGSIGNARDQFVLYLNNKPAAKFDSMAEAEYSAAMMGKRSPGTSIEIRKESCDEELIKKIQESLFNYLNNLINEVGTVPSIGSTAAPAAGNVANVTPQGGTITSKPAAPATPDTIDAMAQMLKNAGLNPAQLNQIITKAR